MQEERWESATTADLDLQALDFGSLSLRASKQRSDALSIR